MSELIDRQTALDALSNAVPSLTTPDGSGQFDRELQIVGEAFVDAIQIVQALPTVNPWHRVEEPPKEEGMYIVAVFFSGHWIFDAAWFTHDITEIYCVPCEKKISGFYRGNHEVHPDYWMPIEPPKEEGV